MFQPLDDLSGFGPDNPENPAQCWQCIIDELLRIRSLKDDWDGEGSEAPHPALVDGAITLAQTLFGGTGATLRACSRAPECAARLAA